uniref:Uncharacterized protein n=1 Tax=Physcomitrium patens TaxID=3218 RepID=A0A2K1L7J9_PHYPA|nr:hypothetical protein PHYPA_000406 [Physcomitrium patens]
MSKSNPPKPPTDVAGGAEEQKEVDINTLTLRLEEAVAKTTQFYSILLGTNAEQKTVLVDSRDCICKLGTEFFNLKENLKKRETHAFAVQQLRTQDLKLQKARTQELVDQLTQKNVDIDDLHAHYKLQVRKVIDEERLKRVQMKVKFGALVEELFNRLEGVKTFMARQREVEERMKAAEKEAENSRAQIANSAHGFEQKCVEKCLQYKESTDKKLKEYMKKVKVGIGYRIGDTMKEVLGQNEVLLAEIQMHSSSTMGKQVEVDRLKAVNTKLRCEIALKKGAEELNAKRTRYQKHVIKHNNIKKLKSLVLHRAKELKKLRHLSEIVLRQRSEVELFLLDSIQHVKNQIYLQKKFQRNQNLDTSVHKKINANCASLDSTARGNLGSTSLQINNHQPSSIKPRVSWSDAGPVHGKVNVGGGEHNAEEQHSTEDRAGMHILFLGGSHDPLTTPVVLPLIDISELSWQEREKVLRYLYKKINTAWSLTMESEHIKQAETMQEEQKYQGSTSEAGRTII